MSGQERDAAARALALVTSLLPGSRRSWRDAMQAELAAIDDARERRRFALGCARAVVVACACTRSTGIAACVASVAALAALVGPAVPSMALLALVLALGRTPGHFGPCRPGFAARLARAAGWALVAGLIVVQMVDAGVGGLIRPMHGGVPWTLALAGPAAAFTAATARASRTGDVALVAGTCAGVPAGVAGFAVLPFARIGTPLADALPWHGSWLVAAVFGAPAIAALVTAARTRSSDQTVMAVACAGAIAALTVALLGIAAIILFPHSVPDIVGSAVPPGTPAAVRQAQNATEAADPYWGFLAFGGLLALLFWATSRPPEKPDLARLLLACLAAPAVALAFVGGAGTIALATGAVVLVAVVRARRGVVAAT